MPSTNKTPKIGLNNWVGTDKPKRADFVADHGILDSLLGGHLENSSIHMSTADRAMLQSAATVGTYEGDGEGSRVITLPLSPKMIVVFRQYESPAEVNSAGGIIINFAFGTQSFATSGIQLDGEFLNVSHDAFPPGKGELQCNLNNETSSYGWVAFR